MRRFGDSFLDIAKGIAQVSNPVLSAGANVFSEQQKHQINMMRMRQGKQPCTSQVGQPSDCPLPLFAPQPSGQPMPSQGPYQPVPARRRSGGNTGLIIVGVVAVIAVVGFLVIKAPKPPTTETTK